MPGRIQHAKEEKGLLYPVWRFRIREVGGFPIYDLLYFIECNVGTWGMHHNLIIIWIISCREYEFSVIYKYFNGRSICKDFYIFQSADFGVAKASACGYGSFTFGCEMHLEPSILIVKDQFI